MWVGQEKFMITITTTCVVVENWIDKKNEHEDLDLNLSNQLKMDGVKQIHEDYHCY
jgi:hypothetical protein